MSLHIYYDHQCPECEAYYIPYSDTVVCPKCGFKEDEVYDIIPELTRSAQYQMDTMGFYTPIAWWVGSFGDHVALVIFELLDRCSFKKEEDFEAIASDFFDKRDWGNQLYLKGHIRDIAYLVYLEISAQKN